MAASSDPACERLDLDSDKQTSSLTDTMAAMTTEDSEGSAANGVKNGRAQTRRTHPSRPHLTGRKLSLQERGTYLSSGSGRGYTHISPRVPRRPTVESKRVSISDSQVRKSFLFTLIINHLIKQCHCIEINAVPQQDVLFHLKCLRHLQSTEFWSRMV